MTKWTVLRWARFGHERLYAETPGGTTLGYLDLKTGQYHCDEPGSLPLLQAAIAAHHGTSTPGVPAHQPVQLEPYPPAPAPTPYPAATAIAAQATPSVPTSAPAPPTAPPPAWQDLSTTRAGAAARERALTEREAQGWLRHGLARLVGAKTEERAWRIGADGEQAVAAQLAKLDQRWRVLHAVPVGDQGSDIDHVVIGPAGVFTVNAKHHPNASVWLRGDTFMVNGQRVPYIRNSRHEARRASKLLTAQAGFPVEALGIIAVMGAQRGFTVKKQPEDGRVVVIQRRRTSKYLNSLAARLAAHEIDVLFDVARRSTTWRQ